MSDQAAACQSEWVIVARGKIYIVTVRKGKSTKRGGLGSYIYTNARQINVEAGFEFSLQIQREPFR
jgi:hypothetical protein